jgi:hypothetical protein
MSLCSCTAVASSGLIVPAVLMMVGGLTVVVSRSLETLSEVVRQGRARYIGFLDGRPSRPPSRTREPASERKCGSRC